MPGLFSVDHQIVCRLVIAKARVAPLKAVTIPRLELTAAALAVRLTEKVRSACRLHWDSIHFWTDSMIVLHYIRNTSSRFATFVANRISEIRDHSTLEQWNHVVGALNPADLVSRETVFDDASLSEWFNGPMFLQEPELNWPEQPVNIPIDNNLLEHKSKTKSVCVVTKCQIGPITTYFSSWVKLVRSVAWLNRFKCYIMIMFSQRYKENSLNIGLLSVHEVKAAEEDIVRIVQNETFSDELQLLTKSTNEQLLPKSSRLFKLNPVIINGILRINSRLINCELKGDFRQPIIMPHDHPATKSLIEYYHSIEGHMGTNQTLSALRSKFWIIKGQRTVRNVIERCLKCKKTDR